MTMRKHTLKSAKWSAIFVVAMAFIFCANPTVFAKGPRTDINVALGSEPPNLNSSLSADSVSGFILAHVMEGLTRFGANNTIEPGIAETWEIDDQGATFHLRKNALWSDGKPITAHDFVFAWQKVVDPANASEYAFIMYPIKNAKEINTKEPCLVEEGSKGAAKKGKPGKCEPSSLGVKATDDHTLKIEFKSPCGYFLSLTAFTVFFPLREDFYQAKGSKYASEAENLLFDGPFTLTSWKHGSSLKLEKNKRYWNAAKVKLDTINIPYITADASAAYNFFKAGQIDSVGLNKELYAVAKKDKIKLVKFLEGTVWFLEFNFRAGRLTTNKNLRKAIQAVFNPNEYVNKIIGIPGTKPAATLIPSWMKGVSKLFHKEYKPTQVKVDLAAGKKYLELARQELEAEGLLKKGEEISLVWLTDDGQTANMHAEYFQNLLKKTLGIELKIDKQIFKQRIDKMNKGEFDIVYAGWGPDYPDPLTFSDLMASWNANNHGHYSNAEYDKLIKEAMATSDQPKRMAAMAKAQALLVEEVGVLPTYERSLIGGINPDLQGVQRHQVGGDPDYTRAYFTK